MKKIAVFMLILIMSISLHITVTAAGMPALAVSATQSGEAEDHAPEAVLPDENALEADSSGEATQSDTSKSDPAALEDQQALEEEPPVKEKFTLFGFTVSNIVTTLLVIGVAVTGLVTKKMGKW